METEMKIQNAVAAAVLLLFVAIATVLIVGAWSVLFPDVSSRNEPPKEPVALKACGGEVPCVMPLPPEIPALPPPTDAAVLPAYQYQVSAYKDRVVAYDKYLVAWNARVNGPDRQARYQAVVKDALVPILNPIVLAFIAFSFVKGTTNVAHYVMAARNQKAN